MSASCCCAMISRAALHFALHTHRISAIANNFHRDLLQQPQAGPPGRTIATVDVSESTIRHQSELVSAVIVSKTCDITARTGTSEEKLSRQATTSRRKTRRPPRSHTVTPRRTPSQESSSRDPHTDTQHNTNRVVHSHTHAQSPHRAAR